ncbi:hypothetical protein HU200_006799 [Digitaria exilis]|uniref:Dof zinc finger protein n=1 Tax=Digitaria exilis TaxID=1010633 RepID=A0A835FQK5_9POAL|nr:hypothetical protein HU200_006799 [Digitaria exilis]
MAPAASILSSATTSSAAAAAASKRPPASDAEPPQGDDEAARKAEQPRPPPQLECPRCQSTNTKFCYYNNYSTAQPRHFCRACRRYWTHGGTLRDVPVGGASRRSGKRRRVSDEPSASASASPPQTTGADDASCLLMPDVSAAFPFLSDGSFLPQLDLHGGAAFSSSWHSSVVPDFYDGLAPWDDLTVPGVTTGAWADVGGLELSWPTAPGN